MSFSPDLIARLSRALRTEQAEQRIPSVAAGVIRGGDLVWAEAVGHLDGREGGAVATPDAQYRIGSITKTFVAVAVLRLVDAGALGLADPLERHVRDTPVGSATIEALLSQSSGIRAETESPWWERAAGRPWSELVGQLALREPARGRFHYSNVGFAVLGELLSRHHGRPWHHVVTDEICLPLGMERTTLRPIARHARG